MSDDNLKGAKICPRCNKPGEFYRDKRRGFRTYCKLCSKELNNSPETRQERLAYHRKYYADNRERLLEWGVQYHQENKSKRNANSRAYYHGVQRQSRIAVDILQRTKSRAKHSGIPFDITLEDIVIPSTCPVLGIPIQVGRPDGMRGPSPNSPSIDRKDPDQGYVRGNVRIISNRANTLKNNATVEELEKVLADLRCMSTGKGDK